MSSRSRRSGDRVRKRGATPRDGSRKGPAEPIEVGLQDCGTVKLSRDVPVLESLVDPSSIVGEELRLLCARVQDITRERGIHSLAVTSALPGEGKSTLSVGLAGALARRPGRRILLVEADLRRPSISRALGLEPAPGLSEWLHGEGDFLPTRFITPGDFTLVVAGELPLERPEVLGSSRMEAVLRAARASFDLVLIDTMPLLPVADIAQIQDMIESFLVVVRSRMTPRDAVKKGLARLRSDKIIGLALNDYREVLPSYTSYAYKRYGMAYGPRPAGTRDEGRSRRDAEPDER